MLHLRLLFTFQLSISFKKTLLFCIFQQQLKRNKPFFWLKISFKLNQNVDTSSLTMVNLSSNASKYHKTYQQEPGDFYNVTLHVTPYNVSCLHFDEQKKEFLSDECGVRVRTLHIICCQNFSKIIPGKSLLLSCTSKN